MTRGQLRHAERLWSDGYAGCRLPVKRARTASLIARILKACGWAA